MLLAWGLLCALLDMLRSVDHSEVCQGNIGCWAVHANMRDGDCMRLALSSEEEAKEIKARMEAGVSG
jgi:hypothetical protein